LEAFSKDYQHLKSTIMIRDVAHLDDVCHQIIEQLPKGGIVLLRGDLASGKTTLVQRFVKFIGLDVEVTSPTFSVMNVYDEKVYHYDIYNEGTAKFIESGLLEHMEKEGYHFIEWADKKLEEILVAYGFAFIMIAIKPAKDAREYHFETA
jgi:tRNA threonylcarbamoyladenosine biosynthesis protein TsaE